MYADFNIVCDSCDEIIVSQKIDVFIIQEGRKKRRYNERLIGAVLASMMNGVGHDGMTEFLTHTGAKFFAKNTFQRYKK